jgi:hypothetical protein
MTDIVQMGEDQAHSPFVAADLADGILDESKVRGQALGAFGDNAVPVSPELVVHHARNNEGGKLLLDHLFDDAKEGCLSLVFREV